jgi:hypothetical protein
MKHTQKKKIEMTRTIRMLAILLVPMVALILGAAVPELWANDDDDDEEIAFDEAELFFELNDTDGDLGIHALIDGEPWKRLKIEDLNERKMLDVRVRGRLRRQGLTELFFESAEPPFNELPPAEFFDRFPAGEYEIEGITLEGEELESEVTLTHLMPAPPGKVTVNGQAIRFPDEEGECEEPLQTTSGDVEIEWNSVTTSHPEIGEPNSSTDITIIRYEAVAEWEDEVTEDTFVSSNELQAQNPQPPRIGVTVSSDFFKEDTEFKVEVLVREESYNQTAVESCPFEYEADD